METEFVVDRGHDCLDHGELTIDAEHENHKKKQNGPHRRKTHVSDRFWQDLIFVLWNILNQMYLHNNSLKFNTKFMGK